MRHAVAASTAAAYVEAALPRLGRSREMDDLSWEGGGNIQFEQGKQRGVGREVVVSNREKENGEGQPF